MPQKDFFVKLIFMFSLTTMSKWDFAPKSDCLNIANMENFQLCIDTCLAYAVLHKKYFAIFTFNLYEVLFQLVSAVAFVEQLPN